MTMQHKYSRLPVYQEVRSTSSASCITRIWCAPGRSAKPPRIAARPPRPFRLRPYLRKPLVVPETKPLHQLIDEFRSQHTHLAMVVDEFGTFTGLVTLEDVLEQVFGEIADEHDVRRPLPVAGAPVSNSTAAPTSAI